MVEKKKKKPEVSIIMPIYNVERYLECAIQSALNQTFEDFELICVNDGSPDKCAEILNRFAAKDERVKIITQANQGLSMARNNGLKRAMGRYVYFFDSDDVIHPQLLEICHGLAERHGADLVSFAYRHSAEWDFSHFKKYDIEKLHTKITKNPLQFFSRGSGWKIFANAWTKFYRRDLLQGAEFLPGIYFEDYPHTATVLLKKPKTVLLKEPLYRYTYNEDSIMKSKFKIRHIQDYHKGMIYIYDFCKKHGYEKELRFFLKNLFSNTLKQQLGRIKRSAKETQPELWQAFAEQLADLDKKGCIVWPGNKLSRYLKYKRLIRAAR